MTRSSGKGCIRLAVAPIDDHSFTKNLKMHLEMIISISYQSKSNAERSDASNEHGGQYWWSTKILRGFGIAFLFRWVLASLREGVSVRQ